MLNEYTVHYEVLDYDGDHLHAGCLVVEAEDRWGARRKAKAQIALEGRQSLHIWDVVKNNL